MPRSSLAPDVWRAGLWLVIGDNGSGKSRLLRALADEQPGMRLLSAESQQAFYERELRHDEANHAQGRDTSRTVGELLGASHRHHPLLSALRLDALWDTHYRALSTGEARKLLLLDALLVEPAQLALDEPFDGLDHAACHELGQALIQLAAHIPVMIAGSFSPRAPLPLPDDAVTEVCVVEGGEVVMRGSPAEWRTRAGQAHVPRTPPIDVARVPRAHAPLDPSQPLVLLRQGRVRYGDQVVFENLDFCVRPGEHTLIHGPNGSGKSTLLEMITGDHPQAYANDLYLFGKKRGSGESIWDIKARVGMVSSKLHRDYRVGGSLEDVLISGLYDSIGVYTTPTPSDRARAKAWLSWLGFSLPETTPFRDLSFGMQRLLLVARAAIKVPTLLVLDEPTTGLDAENRAHVLGLVESLCTQTESTVLFVTHREDERAFWDERIKGARFSLGG